MSPNSFEIIKEYKMKVISIFITLFIADSFFAQTDETKIIEHDLSQIAGVWEIDLRPTPKSQPYLEDFVIKLKEGNDFGGIFYDTKFDNGKLNLNWKKIYFSFSTKDDNNSYYHSGFIEGDKILGITFSPERNFTMPWNGEKRIRTETKQ